MAESRITQGDVEWLGLGGSAQGESRVGQAGVEWLGYSDSAGGGSAATQAGVEFLYDEFPGDDPVDPGFDTFHSRRGRSFEIDVSFRIPPEERLFTAPTLGASAPATPDANFDPQHGYDEALDECFCIIQKGGDRTAPMSWALAVVNIGEGAGTSAPADRPSNYGLCWIWFDAPGWGQNAPASMQYNLTAGEFPTTGLGAEFSTQAFRAILIHKFIEPGKRYNVAVQLQLDSGGPGDLNNITSWADDGFFKVWVSEDGDEPDVFKAHIPFGALVLDGVEVYKGPTDSIDYFLKYGVRYSARDAIFWGLGMRSHVWKKASFIPYGADAAPTQFGGYRMIDRSANTVDSIYGSAVHSLTIEKAALADAFVTINHRGFAASNTNGGTAPMGFWGGSNYLEWAGLNSAGAAGAPYNPEALRGYRLVTTAEFTDGTPNAQGMVLNILSYDETAIGGRYPVTISGGDAIEAFAEFPALVQAFRWHQREIETCELRIWSEPREYDDADPLLAARRKLSLRSGILLDDLTEPDIETLVARWAADDAGGSVLREAVVGGRRAGYLAPFGLGVSEGGTRGQGLLFLSGEGEAFKVDFSENPIAERLLALNQGSRSQGFAVEITCVFPEAFYGIPGPGEPLPDGGVDNGSRPRFVPDVLTWDVPDPDDSGAKSKPRSILALSYRSLRNDENQAPFTNPLPWSVEVATRTDQENEDAVVHSDILPWYVSGAADVSRYGTDAPWVGKPITIQVGIQPTGTDDEYDVYLAMRPKSAINPEDGDSNDSEFAYFSAGGTTYDENPAYYVSQHITIRKRDLARSVICIGGRWSPRAPRGITAGLGHGELNCRMLLDEVRIFGTAGPGALPATNGAETARDGKLTGLKCLPARLLAADEMVMPLGRNLRQANVVDGSATVTPSGGGKFFTANPQDTKEAVVGTAFIARGDVRKIEDPETIGETQEEFYRIESVASDGSSLTLSEPFRDASRSAAAAGVLRLLYYTAFQDDLSEKELSLGAGSAYNPASSTIDDALIVDDLWKNVAPVTATGGLRIYSPLGRGTIQDLLPSWCRGLVRPRRNPILGITGRSGDIYAGARGALFQVDDRWTDDGPSDAIQTSLRFRAITISETGIVAPLHDDRVVFQDATGLELDPDATDSEVPFLDAWVKLDSLAEYQTILWVGELETDPALDAEDCRLHLVMRLRYGTPELVVGSTASPAAEKGLYVATGSTAIQAGEWAHIRWYLPTRASGTVWLKPKLKVNGRTSEVTLNAQDSGVPSLTDIDWIQASEVVPLGADAIALLGASRDSYAVPVDEPDFAAGVEQVAPQRIQGYLHGLQGLLAEFVTGRITAWTGSDSGEEPDDFDPFAIDYGAVISTAFQALGASAEGVGHKIHESVQDQYGLVRSHPFLSVFHEFGREERPISWAQFGTQIYATNGGRPTVIIQGKGRTAGVLPPTTKPGFELQRFPVWTPNVRDKTTNTGTANDPIDGATRGATQVNHYRSSGNSYFRQKIGTADAEVFDWTSGRYFGFKCYWKPASISGRISIWRRGLSKDSGGPFVECRDGKLVFGWYDTVLKKEVYVETSSPVFTPGRVHYIYIRKRFPQNDALEGNWVNSYWSDVTSRRIVIAAGNGTAFTVGETITGGTSAATGRVLRFVLGTATEDGFMEYIDTAGTFSNAETITGGTSTATALTKNPVAIIHPMNDLAIVRRMHTATKTNANVMELDDADGTAFTTRNSLGFPTEVPLIRPAGTVATGFITNIGATYSTTAVTPGQIASTSPSTFHPNVIGMYFQFGSGAFAGKLYRIVSRSSGTTIGTVIAGTTTAEAFGTASGLIGGAFTGIGLTKSPDFDLSRNPDNNGDVEFLGTSLQRSSLGGFAQHDGEMWSPGWTVVEAPTGEDAEVFENVDASAATGAVDAIEVGGDRFTRPIFQGASGEPGELHFGGTDSVNEPATPTATFWCTDARTYNNEGGNSSSQPNGTPQRPPFIEKDPLATHPYTLASRAADPTLRFVQDPRVWSATRFIATAFYDPIQNAVSNPGPILTVAAADEDPQNPSGAIRLLLTDLPQRKGHELWIYESLSGLILVEGESGIAGDIGESQEEIVGPTGGNKKVFNSGVRVRDLDKFKQLEEAKKTQEAARDALEALRLATGLQLGAIGARAVMLRVARFDASAHEYAIRATEETIGEGPALTFDNAPPPACRVLASSGTRLWYGALTKLGQLDGVMYSKAGFPVSLRLTPSVGFFRLASGRGDEITGMMQLDELMVIAKDLAVASATIGPDDLARVETVSGGTGSISPATMVPLDDRGNFLGDRGVHTVSRSGVTNLGRPVFTSTPLENYFGTRMDRRYARDFSATINRARDQYVLLTREVGDTRQRHRISMESNVQRGGADLQAWSPSSFRFSRYETPNLTAIGQVQASPGGPERLVGGTDDGFLVWLDRSDVQGVLLGDDAAIYGDPTLIAAVDSTTSGILVATGQIDTDLEGPRGATVRYVVAGVERQGVILGASAGVLMLDEVTDIAVPLDGVVIVGVMEHRFETPWMTLGNPERNKLAHFLNVVTKEGASGTLRAEVFSDFDATTVKHSYDLDLSLPDVNIPLHSIPGHNFKIKFSVPFPNAGTRFDIPGLVARINVVEQD